MYSLVEFLIFVLSIWMINNNSRHFQIREHWKRSTGKRVDSNYRLLWRGKTLRCSAGLTSSRLCSHRSDSYFKRSGHIRQPRPVLGWARGFQGDIIVLHCCLGINDLSSRDPSEINSEAANSSTPVARISELRRELFWVLVVLIVVARGAAVGGGLGGGLASQEHSQGARKILILTSSR